MAEVTYSSPSIARKMKRIYGSSAKVVKINIRHAGEVRAYVKKIEEAHKKAAKSELSFR